MVKNLALAVIVLISCSLRLCVQGADSLAQRSAMVQFLESYLEIKYPGHQFQDYLYVAAHSQKIYHIQNHVVVGEYTVSTAATGVGYAFGSYQTPAGLHEVAEKIGADLPVGAIIKQKQFKGEIANIETRPQSTGLDLITTRSLHLRGLETGLNAGGACDSYARGIFIHGTHEEGLLGTPASKGCVRMANTDIVALFELVYVGMPVVLLSN